MGRSLTPNRRLQLRIALGMCLVVGPYALLAGVITYVGRSIATGLGALGVSSAAVVTDVSWLLWIGILTPLLIAGTYVLTRRWLDPRHFLDDDQLGDDANLEPRVTRLAKQAGVPAPDVVVADASVPNSFTVGRPGDAVLVVTSALLERLEDEEVDAVLAHELAHVSNRDSILMTIICGVFVVNNVLLQVLLLLLPTFGAKPINVEAGVIASYAVVAVGYSTIALGEWFSVPVFVVLVVQVCLLALAVGLFQASMGYVTAPLTRDRELAADRGAVEITGTAAPLASALETLHDRSPSEVDARARNHGVLAVSLLPYATDLVSRPDRHLSVRLLDRLWPFGTVCESRYFGPVAGVLEWGARSSAAAAGAAVDHPSVDARIDHLRTMDTR
ncbi:M48 family metalloprotease [Natronolimnohabitans sp. A-GB9]|uniref:M48 family metalloprotease n=1 Tax=Natronolimnohabitans sp. A-GB9 TaxID=3069757 RepID=UPI0027AF5B25|nr:M48 family metalloprotease [Natronolimnohabitans sp. A-GB9]MDQ2049999.1 M48 family metalloprotease [Natronolimnohabitans sp. A-GB9]